MLKSYFPAREKVIVHVDDNPGELLLLKEAFHEVDSDASILGFADSDQFLAYLRRRPVDGLPLLAVIDLHLPKLDGLDLLALLKTERIWRDIPVVILSNVLDHAVQERSYALGVSWIEQKAGSFHEYLNLAYRLVQHVPALLRQTTASEIE